MKEVIKKTMLYDIYVKLRYKEFRFLYPYIMNLEETNKFIYESLINPKPFMAAKLGSEELKVVNRFLNNKSFENKLKYTISNNAGFFPPTDIFLKKLASLYLNNLNNLDLLGVCFNKGELEIVKKFNLKLALLGDFYSPWFSVEPWSYALKGKKVLVVHPFEKSIKEQYKKREYLFENKKVLPEFELKTLKAVQSIGGYHSDFKSWFEALEYMKSKIKNIDFDVALIGAGAYGLPLAGFCKKLGKKAIHMGGATQLLFGIYGERWKNEKESKLINSYWKRPYEDEKPKAFQKVENGCYW